MWIALGVEESQYLKEVYRPFKEIMMLNSRLLHGHTEGGGILGFPCHHCYVGVKEKLNNEEDLTVLLKGSDNVVYSVAKLLSLNVSVKPVNCEMNAVLSHFQKEEELVDDVYESDTEALQSCFDVEFENITWATSCARVPVNQHLACVYLHYGNEQV